MALTYSGSIWRSSEEASEALSARRHLLLWAAGLLRLWGLEVNETRPNLASAAPQASWNQSGTPSLFRAPWIQSSASGTSAFLATLRTDRERDREKDYSQNVFYRRCIIIVIKV